MSENISQEQHHAEVAALSHEIYSLTRQLELCKREQLYRSIPDRFSPFGNPTEYRDFNSDYSEILPQIREPGYQIPLEPGYEERRRIKRYYSIGGVCSLFRFIAADYLAAALIMIISGILSLLNPGVDSQSISTYISASAITASVMLTVYLLVNITASVIGMKLSGIKASDLIKTRNYSAGCAVKYCFIAVFLLYASLTVSGMIEDIFRHYGLTTNVISLDGVAVTGTGKAIMMIYSCIIAPVTEELFFRGMLLKTFAKADQRFAVFATAVFFGLAHGNIPQFVLAFIIGVFLAHITLRHGSIIPAIIVHIFVNTFSNVISMLDLHGQKLAVFNEIFIALAALGAIVLLIFRMRDRIPAAMPAQSRRGLPLAISSMGVLLAFSLQFLYLLALIFEGPLSEMIREWL